MASFFISNNFEKHLSSIIFCLQTLCRSGVCPMIDAGDGSISSVICHPQPPPKGNFLRDIIL